MGFRSLFQRRTQRPLLLDSDVVALPPGVSVDPVHAWARTWSPAAQRTADGDLTVPPYFRLVGPIGPDDPAWRRAAMPAGAAVAYAVTDQPQLDQVPMELISCDLASGLARRLGGWYKTARGRWYAGADDTPQPRVYAERALPPEAVIRLLATWVTGLEVTARDEGGYRLESDRIDVLVETDISPYQYALVSQQPWFVSWDRTAVYRVETDDDAVRDRSVEAARVLRDATGGVLLDDDGFPWDAPQPPDPVP